MRVLLVTDIHGEVDELNQIMEKEDFDSALCAGDLSDVNKFDNYSRKLGEVLDVFEEYSSISKAVPGNMDPEEDCVQELRDRRMNVHRDIASFKEFEAVGFGGGITPFGTAFEPEGAEIKSVVGQLNKRMSSDIKVGVIHQPPADTEVDITDSSHVGSAEVRELIEDSSFDLVLTGHIHESAGTDVLDNTTVVNPGPVLEGKYGIAEITDQGIELEMKSLQ